MRPEKADITVGFLPLTDCASVVLAYELGLYRKHGLDVLLSREASWAAVRDKLLVGTLDAAHALYGLVYGAHLGVGSPRRDMAVLLALNQNGQGITLSQHLRRAGVVDGPTLARLVAAGPRRYRFAHTFPTGTHALWLYYWLAAYGVHPLRDVELSSIPPPRMVDSLAMGDIDGCCVGEPWNARAAQEGLGFTVATSQAIWPDHPEKVLATTLDFSRRQPRTALALTAALLEASMYLDAPANHAQVADVLSRPEYLATPAELILPRLRGEYAGGAAPVQDPHAVRFHRDGEVNVPRRSHGIWFLTQLQRWGLLAVAPDYAAVAAAVQQGELYAQAARGLGLAEPDLDGACETLFDGRVFDPARPAEYLEGFAIRA